MAVRISVTGAVSRFPGWFYSPVNGCTIVVLSAGQLVPVLYKPVYEWAIMGNPVSA